MKTFIVTLLMLVPFMAFGASQGPFNLYTKVSCNGKEFFAQGGIICAQDPALASSMKIKIPPTRGQLRVTDCDKDLTVDGNPDDFNTVTYREGFWIFGREVRKLSNTPGFPLPAKNRKDCAIAAAVFGDEAGLQVAAIIQEPKTLDHIADLPCQEASTGLYTCKGLAGSRLAVKPLSAGTLIVLGSGCGINLRSTSSVDIVIPEGACVVSMSLVTAKQTLSSRMLLLGAAREKRELDSPIVLKDGDEVRVIKPLSATAMTSEVYQGETIIWRSGQKKDDSYKMDMPANGTIMCHTAWSQELNSVSGICYNSGTFTEVPYQFR